MHNCWEASSLTPPGPINSLSTVCGSLKPDNLPLEKAMSSLACCRTALMYKRLTTWQKVPYDSVLSVLLRPLEYGSASSHFSVWGRAILSTHNFSGCLTCRLPRQKRLSAVAQHESSRQWPYQCMIAAGIHPLSLTRIPLQIIRAAGAQKVAHTRVSVRQCRRLTCPLPARPADFNAARLCAARVFGRMGSKNGKKQLHGRSRLRLSAAIGTRTCEPRVHAFRPRAKTGWLVWPSAPTAA